MQEQHFKKINQYYFQKVIGSGSFGIVYLGWDDNFKRQVAIKEICISKFDLNQVQDKRQYQMIEKEIEISKKLKNKNIVELYDSFKTEKYIYIIFEYCSNGDLEILFKKNRFQEAEVKAIFQQIIGGIKYLYQQKVVHRDIKLANIYINQEWIIKLGDFGFARNFDNYMQSYCGTPITMAPEIICGKGEYDEKCDIWSLGMILYMMVFGSSYLQQFITPKTSLKEFSEIVQKQEVVFPAKALISQGLRDLFTRMLKVDAKKRIGYQELFEHYWITEGENESFKKSVRCISKRMNSGEASDIKIPLQQTINEQLSYQFGQYGIVRNEIIENIRDMLNLCQNIDNVKRLCETFLKKLRSSQNNYQITIIMKNQNRIFKEGKVKIFDIKFKLTYLLLKILQELIMTDNVTNDRLEKAQKLFDIAQKTNISNVINIKITKEEIEKMNDQELNQQFEQLGDELREIMIQQQARQQQRPHKKEYEIIFENKQLEEQTTLMLGSVIENFRLLRKNENI
ncbi:unnamed protein product [Paramecium primaurelia]|uniref:Protein kinase domain-containing protein n=1 Tax=Paramecium primaurelia TaxID=5886 RepID=A0A8S1LWU6_PARPR|nr:unnamed protein product [Paramecium primaurelia]